MYVRKQIAAVVMLLSLTMALAAQTSVVQPRELDARLRTTGEPPTILYVGFVAGYRAGHIPGAILAGPAESAEGLTTLAAAVMELPRDREIVVYCGCCPWDSCPNIRPALVSLRQMGFTRVKALVLPNNFAADWVARGYPVEPPAPRP
jgi:thiosulfate/3-mercaptopyruvate sulfurtransferase